MEIKSFIKAAAVTVLVLGTAGGYFYVSNAPKAYKTSQAVRGNISGSIKESGNVHGSVEKVYYAMVSAPVADISIEEGDVIGKGDLLLSYDVSDLQHALTQAELTQKQITEEADGAIAKSEKYEGKYAKAAADDNAYAVLYAMEREQSNAISEDQYSENYQKACDSASLQKQIASKQGEISAKQYEISKYTDGYGGYLKDEYKKDGSFDKDSKDYKKYKKLNSELNDLNQELYSLQSSLSGIDENTYTPAEYAAANDTANVMEDISRNWNQAKSDKATAEAAILNDSQKEALRTAASKSEDTVAQATDEVAKANAGVVSEFCGVVTSCETKKDAFVTEGTPLFTVESSEELKVELMISKYDIGKVAEGQKAVINIAGNKYDGTVSRIKHLATSDSSDKNKIKVEVSFDEPDEDAIIGIEADVTISTQESENTVLVPFESYYTDDDGSYCYVIDGGRIGKKYFEAGVISDDYVEAISGINEGDVIITDGVAETEIGKKAVAN